MSMSSAYLLSEGVQVRSERFGLLFYQYAGPKLHFVPSQDLVDPSFFSGEQTVGNLIGAVQDKRGWSEETAERHLSRILKLLKLRNLIHEQPIR